MADSLSVMPGGLRGAGADLDQVSKRFKQVLTSLNDQLAGEGSPWAADKIGRQFAAGDKGYVAQRDWATRSFDDKASLLDYYSQVLSASASIFEDHDR
jgi:hypothetical protein